MFHSYKSILKCIKNKNNLKVNNFPSGKLLTTYHGALTIKIYIMTSKELEIKYFKLWQDYIRNKKYDDWCEIHDEEIAEMVYARNNNMEPMYWCWGCQYSECFEH